ncbi:UDP-N-acetylglucosamine pyrophosphorylase [Quillaja saponaria]|uniref:UDP-N-acetylglucosamine pyrophosphorylase n=1 Tax=Quillaja saponaria TaxID=32244 RepID=A0AAD7L507_QUISA|nr:UDP-N-acetylglucosamine pyrophosphorylase [Quillaja saponaria]KAJ7951709.1 UDP-N-acetylglucosamine pyrophosphorylase [Quillaja saponaria]
MQSFPIRSQVASSKIDELVALAFKLKAVGKEGRREIECFTHVLDNMLSSLKPWVPKFQKALATPSVDHENQPGQTLVSGRADSEPSKLAIEGMASSKTGDGPTTLFTISRDINDGSRDNVVKPSSYITAEKAKVQDVGFISSSPLSKRDSSLVVMTPCSKLSPPKSCVLLEPISESSHPGGDRVCKGTPFPVGVHRSLQTSDSSGSDASQDLALKYPELLGIHQVSKLEIRKKVVEASPDWFMSPPKTCVLLNPPDEKSLENTVNDSYLPRTNDVMNELVDLSENDVLKGHDLTKKKSNEENIGGNLRHIESTPMWNEPESTFRTGKRPGENTLKKELWTKFEAATSNGIQFNVSTLDQTTKKGFLDLLDEASCEGES